MIDALFFTPLLFYHLFYLLFINNGEINIITGQILKVLIIIPISLYIIIFVVILFISFHYFYFILENIKVSSFSIPIINQILI